MISRYTFFLFLQIVTVTCYGQTTYDFELGAIIGEVPGHVSGTMPVKGHNELLLVTMQDYYGLPEKAFNNLLLVKVVNSSKKSGWILDKLLIGGLSPSSGVIFDIDCATKDGKHAVGVYKFGYEEAAKSKEDFVVPLRSWVIDFKKMIFVTYPNNRVTCNVTGED